MFIYTEHKAQYLEYIICLLQTKFHPHLCFYVF